MKLEFLNALIRIVLQKMNVVICFSTSKRVRVNKICFGVRKR